MSRSRIHRTVSLLATFAVAVHCLAGCSEPEPIGETESPLVAASALLVVGGTPLVAGDAAFKQRLEALGLTVLVRKDAAVCGADVAGKKLVAVSSTVTPHRLAVSLRATAVPVLTWEPALFDAYGLVANAGARGTEPRQTTLDANAGAQVVVTAPQSFAWGLPGAAATVVARLTRDASKAAIFRYERGAPMFGLAAPERRVGLFLGDGTAALLTAEGQALVDGAISWAAPIAKQNGRTCSAANECASGFCAQGVCCASACDGACTSCALAATFGQCAPLPAGAVDPQGTCAPEPPSSCGLSGRCDGAGACQRYAAGTLCAAASCDGATFTPAATCDGDGACISHPTSSCAPYTCAQAVCRSACTIDADCVPGSRCVSNACN